MATPASVVRKGFGPEAARIMVVGEAWGEQEETTGVPFIGASGELLNAMLHEAGIMRTECYVTNVVNARPPYNDITKWVPKNKSDINSSHVKLKGKSVLPIVKEGYDSLMWEIDLVKPDIVIALGNTPLWALTPQSGVMKWRGSQMYSDVVEGLKVIPTIHPAAVLRDYSWRPIVVTDLRRARKHTYPGRYKNHPEWRFIIRPGLGTVTEVITKLLVEAGRAKAEGTYLWLEGDLETTPRHIACLGISWTRLDAICIPFCYKSGAHYWGTAEEEARVVHMIYRLFTHPAVKVRMQNGLYDCQHIHRWWHFIPNIGQDTMLSHHSMFSGMKKSLDFQASFYCDYYEYWKEMHKDLSNKAGA